MNKDMVRKIREEADQLLGSYPSNHGRVTHDNYKQFTYTYSALLETLRLHPPVPKVIIILNLDAVFDLGRLLRYKSHLLLPSVHQNLKFAKTDDVIPGGPTIEAGDCVTWRYVEKSNILQVATCNKSNVEC